MLLLLLALFLIGCADIKEEHEEYLSSRGWEIKKIGETNTYTLELAEEILEGLDASGIHFMRKYNGKEVTNYEYTLKQKATDGQRLMAYIYEYKGEIIGGSGYLPTHVPGGFNLDDKERLVQKELIK